MKPTPHRLVRVLSILVPCALAMGWALPGGSPVRGADPPGPNTPLGQWPATGRTSRRPDDAAGTAGTAGAAGATDATDATDAATDEGVRVLERRLFMLVNGDRVQNGVRPLAYREDLATVARSHSLDLTGGTFFDHVSPTTGAPQDRIFRAGIPASRTGENIARDVSIEQAQIHLMESPGHRANILSSDFDHIGIGIVESPPYLFVTQIFIHALPIRRSRSTQEELLANVNRSRRSRGLPRLSIHPTLQQVCQEVADQMNRTQYLDSGLLTARLKASRVDYLTIQVWVAVTAKPESLLDQPFLTRRRFNSIGLGLSVNRTAPYGLGSFWTAVAVADIRR